MLKRLGLAAGQLIRIEAAAPPGGQPPSAAVVASARAIVQVGGSDSPAPALRITGGCASCCT